MTSEPTKCIDCDNLHGSAREGSAVNRPEYWLCSAHPRISYVHGAEPFMQCRGINGGACPMFKPLRSEADKAAEEPASEPPPAEPPFSKVEDEQPPWSELSAKVLGKASAMASEDERRKVWTDNAKELHQLKLGNPDEHVRLTKAFQQMNAEMLPNDPPF